ncbi:Nuclear receptor coregulator SMRT/SMRTER [Phytophthora cinnamomi]|uniref:Nuclear receptor coregulator SMRT/SMRTER n=1 Tax=Phytophthora cinnamomi TaxID=4785 RepID=UPI003559F0C2|nr:Nuclear receptor coregulator SMRT/SMRTER [Phytophthora cinnamomi]
MAEDSSRASSPEPGEAAPPRGRIVQLKASSRGSMERQSLESARAGASPAYSQQSQQWRGSPPRSRFPRPSYSGSGGRGGYFKRQQQQQQQQPVGYDAGTRERVFSRARGRSVSRSPSRASQRTRSRSRSHSPKSPPRSRSRSRSRSFSPRGHRTFANWERGGRNPPAAGPYASSGRGGRGGSFDGRQRARERDSWPRGGGRGGGGRYAGYQRGGNRFYPKEVRYKASAMPHRRSISRDRSGGEGAAQATGFRDRQTRDRDQRERDYEQAYRGRTRESNRSTSLARTASYSSDYYRDSEPSASAEEGEEKPEECHVTTSERSLGSRSPSDTGSTDRDMTSATDNSLKRTATNAVGSSNANAAAPAKRVVQKWTEGEKADFLKYFSQYGKDWATLTENIPTKTAAQIKNYYQNYKNRLNLQDILKRRIENAATTGAAKGAAHPGAASAARALYGNAEWISDNGS